MTGSWYTHPELILSVFALAIPALIIFVLWSVAIKGCALWFAARNGQKGWFVFLLVVNLLGIPELVYLIWFRKGDSGEAKTAPAPVPAPSTIEGASKEG